MESLIYHVSYYGKQAHAAAHPWDGRSAFDALEMAFYAVDMLQKRLDGCKIRYALTDNGGIPANVVPDFATGSFYLCANDSEALERLSQTIKRIFEGTALMTETKAEYVLLMGKS